MENGLHADTRTPDEAFAEGRALGAKDFAEVSGDADAVDRRIKFCANMAKAHEGTNLGSWFEGRLAGLQLARVRRG